MTEYKGQKVYWHVYWRWTIWYGEPEKVICVWSCDETQKSRFDPEHVFETNREAVEKADSYRYQRDASGTRLHTSNPNFRWPPDRVDAPRI